MLHAVSQTMNVQLQTLVAPCVKEVYELFTFLYLLKICQLKHNY